MKSKIGKTISYFRKQAGLTQKQLAGKLYVSDKAVSKWERGLSYPDVTFISKLTKIFDIDTDALFIEEDKYLSESWCGILYFPKDRSKIKLYDKICNKYVLEIIICYFLLVCINRVIIVCDEKDNRFSKRFAKLLSKYNIEIEVLSHNKFHLINQLKIFKKASSLMLVYDLFFIYGVGLTSTFQRAMIDNNQVVSINNPKIPLVFGEKDAVLSYLADLNNDTKVRYIKMFKGYIVLILNRAEDMKRCAKLISVIESALCYKIYNIFEIIKTRNLA